MKRRQVCQIIPSLFSVRSVFQMSIGCDSLVKGSRFFLVKWWSMHKTSAPLSTKTWVSTTFMMWSGVITWMGIFMDFDEAVTVTSLLQEGEKCINHSSLFKNPWQRRHIVPLLPRHTQSLLTTGFPLPLPFGGGEAGASGAKMSCFPASETKFFFNAMFLFVGG